MASFRITVALILVAIMMTGAIIPGIAYASHDETSESEHPTAIDDGDVFEVSSGGQIHVWERAGYTLRTDDTDAPTRFAPPTIIGESVTDITPDNDFGDSQSLVRDFGDERNPIGVHDSGADVRMVFDASYATAGPYSGLNEQANAQLVAARLDPEADRAFTTAGTFEFFADIESANRNASFEILTENAAFNSTGQLTETASFDSGRYIVFVAVHESSEAGIETGDGADSGNISVDGNITIVGVDRLTVQQGQTVVTEPTDTSPGETLTFGVDTSDTFEADEDVTHAVAVYDQSTFESARFDVVINQSAFDGEVSFENATQLERSINQTNGVVAVEDGTTLGGASLADRTVQLPVGPVSLIDFLSDGAGVNDSTTHPITNGGASNSDYETLDTSVTAVNGVDRTTTLSVDTYGNFSTGQYRYVVMSAPDNDPSQLSTASGQVTLSSGGGGGGDGDDGGDGGDNGNDMTVSQSTGPIVLNRTVDESGSGSWTIDQLNEDQLIVLNIERNETEAGNESAVWVNQLNITSTADAEDVAIAVTLSEQPSADTPENDRNETNFRYLNVETTNLPNAETTPGTFRYRISQQQLNESGIEPAEINMFRYHDGTWESIDESYMGDGRFSADTPGFSWFAISGPGPNMSITAATLNTSTVSAGGTAALSLTVENTGTLAGNTTLNVTANGERIESRTVAVAANESATQTVILTFESPGAEEIAVNGESVGTVTVTAQSGSAGTPSAVEQVGQGSPTATANSPAGDTGTDTPAPTAFLGAAGPMVFIVTLVVLVIAVLGAIRYRVRQ
jgi:PGF-pre-PGF domain-containing protein